MTKTHYVCRECGATSAKWLGQCPSCNAWNTLDEARLERAQASRFEAPGVPAPRVELLASVPVESSPRS